MWLELGAIVGSYLRNGTDEKHAWYNFHTELQYAVNDFLVQLPSGVPTTKTAAYGTLLLLDRCTRYFKFQIQGDRIQRKRADRMIRIGKYMEIKTEEQGPRKLLRINRATNNTTFTTNL
eukprot:56004-Amphidinium_carterae.1